jgi:hypothetical protein
MTNPSLPPRRRSRRSCFHSLWLAALLAAPVAAPANVDCDTVGLPGNHRENGMWSALYAAKNGMVYIGAEAHGGEANFYQYDPKTKTIRHVANMYQAAGEYGKGIRGQSKIHTRFVEDGNGIIYFGSGNQGSGPKDIDPRSWSGGHWWSYDPSKDKVEDLGLVDRGYSDLYGLAYDRVRHRLYATGWNAHLYIFDIKTRTTKDAGRVSNWDVCRTIVADDQGNCYGTSDKEQLFKYDAEAGRLLDLPLAVPHDEFQWPQRPLQLDRKNIWRVGEWSDHDKCIYIIEGGASYLSRYDPQPKPAGSIELLSQLCAPQFRGSHNIPYATLSMTIGRDQRIYFAPTGTSFDYESPGDEGANKEGMMTFLVVYDPATKQRIDYGKLIDKAGGNILGTQGGACGPDGTIYFFGAVEGPAAAQGGKRAPFSLKLIVIDPSHLTPLSRNAK